MLFQDLGLFVLLLGRVVAEVPDPEKDLVLIANAQSVVIGNFFYTLGGYATFNVPDGFPRGTKMAAVNQVTASNGHLRRIDLTRPFTVSKIDTVQERSVPLSDEVPRMRSATMWAHNSTIYLGPSELEEYPLLQNGSWINNTRSAPLTKGIIWTYDTANPDTGWKQLVGRRYESTFSPVIEGSVAYLDGIAYIMGGTYRQSDLPTSNKKEVWLGSLFMKDVERGAAISETSPTCEVSSGEMVSIKSAGKNGILVYIGGLSITGYNDMSIIRVYDIASSTWHVQRATSTDVFSPYGRYHFCAVVMSAQDHSSHQIYFYGGLYQEGKTGLLFTLDDVWVLTLPSFQFIKVGGSVEASRFSGTCAVISPQYLLAYRGSSGESNELATRNASLALLDLTDLEWKTEYTPADTASVYRVPQKVIEVIGGDETGNATITAPALGFDDEFLKAVFNFSRSKKPTLSSNSSSTSTTSALKNRLITGVSIASAILALLSITLITLTFRLNKIIKLYSLAEELGLKPWEIREVDGYMVVPVKHELEEKRPVVCEIGGERDGGREGGDSGAVTGREP